MKKMSFYKLVFLGILSSVSLSGCDLFSKPSKNTNSDTSTNTNSDTSTNTITDTSTGGDIEDTNPLRQYTKTLTMSGSEFTILNLTDIQLDNSNTLTFTKKLIDSCVSYKRPDMIAVLGDNINDNKDYDADVIAPQIFDLLESYNIPWAPIFGNHDQAGYQDPSMSKRTIGSEDLSEMLLNKTRYPHCLYIRGPEDVDGLSNYMVNVKDESGKLVESLVFLDSLKHGLNSTHVSFYENMINYSTELNHGTVVKSAVFDHIPLPEYKAEYTKLVEDEFRNVNGFVGMSPVINSNTPELFPKFKELGSTTTMLCGHDHMNSYYTELDGIKLGYAMKSSEGDDEGGEPYKYMMGGCYLTVDGVHEDKIEYKQYSDFDFTIQKDVHGEKGFNFHFTQVPFWKGSGGKLKFNIRLPETGSTLFNISGTNTNNEKINEAYGSWNRLTEQFKIDATNKTISTGTMTQVEGNLYTCELDLMNLPLNTSANEKSHGDETARLIYFHHFDMDFAVNNIRIEYENITETNQIDLSNSTITPIADQTYLKGKKIKPTVEVTLNGRELTEFEDYNLKYSNNSDIGEASLTVIPSGKGAHKYKGSVSTTFNIVGNPFRGTMFEKGFSRRFEDIPLTETIIFDVHFTSTEGTMYFMFGDGWDEYFGYYGLKSDGTLVDPYDGVSVKPVEDDYFRVTCVLSQMNKQNGGTPNPTEKVNLFFIHNSWGGEPTGYIDFDLSEAPAECRGDVLTKGYSRTFDDLPLSETFVFDVKFTSLEGTMWFMLGDGWDKLFGYYGIKSNGMLEATYDGVTVTKLSDGYVRVTCVLSQMNKQNGGTPNPTEKVNLFYIHGSWGGEPTGYIDLNPTL